MANHSQGKIMLPKSTRRDSTYILAEDANFTFSDEGNVEAYGGNLFCESISPENAARSVECWNGCIGIANPSAVRDVITTGDILANAERSYRLCHDLKGDGHIETGRAWDNLRRCGDNFRKALARLEGGAS